MKKQIVFLDRMKKQIIPEKVYGRTFIEAFYGDSKLSWFLYRFCLPLLACYPFVSKLYGLLQKSRFSKKKVLPFIQEFQVDPSEFLKDPASYSSFNDFFIRKLKPGARPIAQGGDVAILPADGRYLVYPNIAKVDGFLVKGKKFSLQELLGRKDLASLYEEGAMVIARLCPTDYHRFHFPCNCTPSEPELVSGFLHSVNPLALRKKIEIFSQNKRAITTLQTRYFGQVLFIEIGATCVGTIHQTFAPHESYSKGEEKGYFSFGGSSLILLFEPGKIELDQDLVEASAEKLEVKGLMGQTLGRSLIL
jgi:phosphatidylserine decarboxylase